MLPCRSDSFIITAALAAGCLMATAGWAQSIELHDTAVTGQSAPRDDESVGTKFELGPATIDINHLSLPKRTDRFGEFFIFPPQGGEPNNASFTLNLSDFGESSLIPESLNLTARKTDLFGQPQFTIGSFGGDDQDDRNISDYIVSADWGAPEDRFTFSFSSRFAADRPYAGEPVDISDDMLNFTRTLKAGGWLSSFTASIGRGYREESGNREHSSKIGASANFQTGPSNAPHFDITAKVLQDRAGKSTPGSGEVDTKWELRTGSEIFGAMSPDDLGIQPSLSIFFSVMGNSPAKEEEDINPIDFSAGVSGKVHF
jgi:hypothetical protein